MTNPIWILCPVVNNLAMTMDALGDFLDQSVPTRVLLIYQGTDPEMRQALEREAELKPDRIFLWSQNPPLPSLSASWNRGLDFIWETGADKALVVNNDVRIHRRTVEGLMGCLNITPEGGSYMFVSAVAVAEEQYQPDPTDPMYWYDYAKQQVIDRGGPDFSCFMLTKAAHQKYRFDENFIPAYCEDLDTHRRYMLGGDGDKIFSVNLPYLHFASGTLKTMTPEQRMKKEAAIAGSRNYYQQKWGGPVNEERFYTPFGQGPEEGIVRLRWQKEQPIGPTTPELQSALRENAHAGSC